MNATTDTPSPRAPHFARAVVIAALVVATIPVMFVIVYLSTPMPPPPVKVVYAESAILDSFPSAQHLVDSEMFRMGRDVFIASCTACHGEQGESRQGLGKDIVGSAFTAGCTDDELAAMIRSGRAVSHPLNTTGVDMPPRGGNPALNDREIREIIAYVRGLQAAHRGEAVLSTRVATR